MGEQPIYSSTRDPNTKKELFQIVTVSNTTRKRTGCHNITHGWIACSRICTTGYYREQGGEGLSGTRTTVL
ncbi:hypothetical protein COCON_G00169920 [Conger conger]|uniref:Uncharacterized protein n=1 Tax=Conger conger TaxID=82655 RepID=A0A9Q1D8F1_CONCO|nr:hypothetical protein COCON_G00169920 [Conger conger]